jgi:hypothetical protein
VTDPESAARASLFRSLLIYSALFVVAALVIGYILASGVQGAGYVSLSFSGIVGLLLAYQVWLHGRDLRSPLSESEGVVLRKWQRADLIIAWQSFYLQVDRAIFKLRPEDYILLDEGMYVKVVHFPRTLNVVSIHQVQRAAPPPPSSPLEAP